MADDFEEKSLAFKDWFLSHDGASINPDVDLADFRSEGRGRGAGMFVHDVFSSIHCGFEDSV